MKLFLISGALIFCTVGTLMVIMLLFSTPNYAWIHAYLFSMIGAVICVGFLEVIKAIENKK